MHLEVFKGKDGAWYVHLVGGNGEKMMHSEAYASKWNAERAAKNIQEEWVEGDEGLPIIIEQDV